MQMTRQQQAHAWVNALATANRLTEEVTHRLMTGEFDSFRLYQGRQEEDATDALAEVCRISDDFAAFMASVCVDVMQKLGAGGPIQKHETDILRRCIDLIDAGGLHDFDLQAACIKVIRKLYK